MRIGCDDAWTNIEEIWYIREYVVKYYNQGFVVFMFIYFEYNLSPSIQQAELWIGFFPHL